ncbi:hypothetical protein GCM10027605_12760 [Micromonospora zhanjiangensis]
MKAGGGGAPVTVVCPDCDGLTFVLRRCHCVSRGDRFLVDEDAALGKPADEAYRECRVCGGAGSVAQACGSCRQRGSRRAQLVLTVANLDTGAVASREVVPGAVPPDRRAGYGWCLPLDPVVRELAAAVGAGSVRDVRYPDRPVGELVLSLPARWRPDLPATDRYAIEAQVVAGQDYHPWWVFLGRTAAETPRDLDRDLGRLCEVAELLRLDLVVEARRQRWGELSWDIRYELPGADVPDDPTRRGADLPAAVAATTVADALYGLDVRGRRAPAYTIEPAPPDRVGAPIVDLDQVERRIYADLADAAGAQAVWRDGRWWHVRLRVGGTIEILTERDTGQVTRRTVTALHRVWQPPAPSWWGTPIGYDECPDCRPAHGLRRCYCTMGGRPADPHCAACSGAGMAPSPLPCHTCRGSHRRHHAVAVTLTDLRHRVVHQTWRPTPGTPAPLVATQPGGKPVHQLPDRYRLARWAPTFRVRPEDLTEADLGQPLGQDLRDGTVTLPYAGADPLTEHLHAIGRGLPGARLLVLACAPDVPPLTELIRLAHGLHLAIVITVEDHRQHDGDPLRVHGHRWEVDVVPPDALPTGPDGPAAGCDGPLAGSDGLVAGSDGPLAGSDGLVAGSDGPLAGSDGPAAGSDVLSAGSDGPRTFRLEPPLQQTVEAAVASCLTYLELALARTVPTDPGRPVPVPQSAAVAAMDDPTPSILRLAHHYAGQPVTVHLAPTGCRLLLHERDGIRQLAQAGTPREALSLLGLHHP